jgi:D-alanyl-D-alanine carboxypeptidase
MIHALMLPSANDAAMALAEHFGKIIFDERRKLKSLTNPLYDMALKQQKDLD